MDLFFYFLIYTSSSSQSVVGKYINACTKGHLRSLLTRFIGDEHSLINKRFPWADERHVTTCYTDFWLPCIFFFSFYLRNVLRISLLAQSLYAHTLYMYVYNTGTRNNIIIIQSPIRWKTFRRFAVSNEPWGPFFIRMRTAIVWISNDFGPGGEKKNKWKKKRPNRCEMRIII